MALSSTIFKLELQVSDLDRHYYQAHNLTVARHPSETELRMLVRILVFALNADETLTFTRGLSTDDVPDLWTKNLRGEIEDWIEVGQPSLKRLKKASQQAERVTVYTYSGHSADIWWQKNSKDCAQLPKMRVVNLPADQLSCLEAMLNRTMRLQCTLQDGSAWLTDGQNSCEIQAHIWQDRPD